MKIQPTWDRLFDLIAEGFGCGFLDTYKTWLRVHRKNASPVSNQVVCSMPGYTRQAHFFARVEWYIALLCLWLGAFDVREQFPLWPMRHKHPLAFGSNAWRAPEVEGLWSIAKRAGIRHGTEIGGDGVPYVATMDVMATLDDGASLGLSGISLKPHDAVTRAEPTDRLVERQELERRYSAVTNSHYVIADAALLTPTLMANLDACGSFAHLRRETTPQIIDFLSFLEETSRHLDQRTAVQLGARSTGLPISVAREQLMAAIWRRDIDVDITQPIRPDMPLPYGGHRIAKLLQQELFGRML